MSKFNQALLTTGLVLASYEAFKIEGDRLSFSLPVPGSIEKYDELANKQGAALESSIDNVVYRGGSCLPEIRYQFTQAFEAQVTREFPQATDLKRKVKITTNKKNEEKSTFAEGEAEYVRRALPILAELRGVDEIKVSEFQPLLDRVMEIEETDENGNPVPFLKPEGTPYLDEDGNPINLTLVRFDPSEREAKERGPKTLAKKYLKAGEQIVADGIGDKFIAHYSVMVEIPDGADEATVSKLKAEAIGWKVKALEDAEAAKTNLSAKYAV